MDTNIQTSSIVKMISWIVKAVAWFGSCGLAQPPGGYLSFDPPLHAMAFLCSSLVKIREPDTNK
jgi:hypothetical protein